VTTKQVGLATTFLALFNLGLFWFLYHSIKALSLPAPAQPPHLQVTTPIKGPLEKTLTLRAVGDVMLGRAVNLRSLRYQDFTWPFRETIPYLPPVDIFVGNLETPLVSRCEPTAEGMVFCAPASAVTGLVYAGFNLLSLANNHAHDQGVSGRLETEAILTEHGLDHLWHRQSLVRDYQGLPIGFAAFDDITYPLSQTEVETVLKSLANRSAAVVVLIHWGHEYHLEPSPRQRLVAGWLESAGAHIVLGAHPHVLQPIDQPQKNQLIAYSLGNFVFDQMWSEATRQGLILDLKLTFSDGRLTTIDRQLTPVTIFDYGQPRLSN
jgi:poly-gamma-glutamate capsule biosynthesis protein CapA/YwtB (metallophosphatase superfamily)